jgi:hypothetical protein
MLSLNFKVKTAEHVPHEIWENCHCQEAGTEL